MKQNQKNIQEWRSLLPQEVEKLKKALHNKEVETNGNTFRIKLTNGQTLPMEELFQRLAELLIDKLNSPSINIQHVDTLNNYHGACHIAAVGKTQVCSSEKDYNTSASVPFSALVTNPSRTDAILKKLHELVERPGKPKTIIMPIRAAMDAGAISRPTWEQFCSEFGVNRVKSKSSLTDYTNENYNFVGNDFESMKATFCSLMQ